MTVELPPDKRAEMWILRIVLEEGGISVGRLRDRVPCGRDRLQKALKNLAESGRIIRDGNGIYPSGTDCLKVPDEPGTDCLKVPETAGLVPPHAPPPKDLKPGFNTAREANSKPSVRDLNPYVVVCTWREFRGAHGLCDFAHQTFFGNRNDGYAHFKAHCREPHPSANWEVALVERKTGENLETFSTEPYEKIPYEVAQLGLNAFIQSRLEGKRI